MGNKHEYAPSSTDAKTPVLTNKKKASFNVTLGWWICELYTLVFPSNGCPSSLRQPIRSHLPLIIESFIFSPVHHLRFRKPDQNWDIWHFPYQLVITGEGFLPQVDDIWWNGNSPKILTPFAHNPQIKISSPYEMTVWVILCQLSLIRNPIPVKDVYFVYCVIIVKKTYYIYTYNMI